VGIIDSGAQPDNPALVDRIAWFKDYVDPDNTAPQDTYGHGTVMAQIIGGTANASAPNGYYNYGGVAPQASLYIARIAGTSGAYNFGLASQALSDLAAQGVQLINNSYSYAMAVTDSAAAGIASQRYDQLSSALGHGQLLVWSAGNSGLTQPNIEPGLPYLYPSLQQNWLAVVNVDTDANGQVTGLNASSNACGVAASWCLSAPGTTFVSPVPGTMFSNGSSYGTSNAAAVVTGVAALVWQRFPYFSAGNVQQTLLSTATPIGNDSSSVYGAGLVNAEAAVKGPASFGDSASTFDLTIPAGYSSTFSNAITGGNLVLNGAGALTLAQASQIDSIVVNGGTLHMADDLSSQVTVNACGSMYASGTLTAPGPGVINNGAFGSQGSLSINGHYTASSNATTVIPVTDPLTVSGTATLNQSNLQLIVPNAYTLSTSPQQVLQSSNLEGTFGSLSIAGSVYLSGTLSYTSDAVAVTLTQNSVASVAAASMPTIATTQQTAQHIQAALEHMQPTEAASNDVFVGAANDFLHADSIEQATVSINSLSGQWLVSSQALTLQQASIVNRTIADRLADLGDGSATQGLWFQGTGASGTMARAGYATGSYSGGGSVLGYDVKLTESFTLGLGIDWNRLDSSYTLQGGMNKSRTKGGMLYARYNMGHAYVTGRVGEDWIEVNTSRWGLLGATPAAIASNRNDRMTSAYLEWGRDTIADAWVITPFVSAGNVYLRRGVIAEDGAGGFGIAAPSKDFNQSNAQLGARLGYHWRWSGGQIALKGYALYQRVLSGDNLGFNASYAGAPAAVFSLQGVNSPRNTGWVGLGLNAELNSGWSWFVNMDGQIAGEGTRAAILSIGGRYSF
jgi:uncharacterized protein with beta-barrel porin domain